MKRILFSLSILLIFSCTENPQKNTSNEQGHAEEKKAEPKRLNQDSLQKVKIAIHNSRLDFKKIDSLFKFSRIKNINKKIKFDMKEYNRLSAEEFFQAFQDSAQYYYDPEFSAAYYYSNQGEWNGYKRYIFVLMDDVCCEYYYYNIYDTLGKLVNSVVIEKDGDEGGWTIVGTAKFPNDSTIIKATNDCDASYEGNTRIEDCDSTIVVYHLLKDGKVRSTKQYGQKTKTKK